jgi:hypothetical protein
MRPDASAQRFAAYMDANVPRDALVETWDPELGLLTDHLYHYPPQPLLDAAVRRQWLGGAAPLYDWQSQQPPYVVVGPFGSYTEVYKPADLARAYEEQHRDGTYVLFKRKN